MRKGVLVFSAVAAFTSAAWAGGAGTIASALPSARLVLQLGVLVLAAKIGGVFFERCRLPVVLGEILSGVLVGPHLLGGLALPLFPNGLMSDVERFLFPGGAAYGVVTLTLVVLFFLIGLDTDVRQMRRYPVGGVMAGIGGFALSFAAVLAVLVHVAVPLTGQPMDWASPSALLVGAALSVTSVGVLARLLSARQRLETPSGVMALTAAMTDNVVGLLVFTVFAGVAQAVASGAAPGGALIASVAVRTVAGVCAVALVGIPVARRLSASALREKSFSGAFVASSACLLVAGGIMGVVGLSSMTGAYLMGVAFSSTDLRHEIRARLDFISTVLVPACFAALGMHVNPNLLADGTVVGTSLLFAVAALAAKMVGCGLPSLAAGLDAAGALRVGAASVPRGELSLAMLVAVLGLIAPSEGLFFGLVLTITLSCLCASALTDLAYAFGGGGVRGSFVAKDPVRLSFRFPSHQAAVLMVNRAVELFEDEGFYAQLLNRHQAIYRISREAQVITLRQNEGEVVFECSERERQLVNTVMLELASGVEQHLRELQKPLDDVALRKDMQRAPTAGTAPGAVLRNRFLPETLRPRLLATTKQGVITELVGLLCERGLVSDRERATQAVLEREQSLSTGMEYGVAIPHARTDAVSQLVCAIGLKKDGLDFGSLDGRPVRIVVLVLAPENAPAPQLQFIAQMCRLLNEQGRAALLACETGEDMYGFLSGGVAAREKGHPFAACLQWQSIALDVSARDREGMLALLLALCARSGAVDESEGVRRDMQAQADRRTEEIVPGVTLLSVETPHVFRPVAALGVRPESACGADGAGRVWAMLLFPPSAASETGRVRQALARALGGSGLGTLLAAKTSKEALDVLIRQT